MSEAEARELIFSSKAWGSSSDYTLVDLERDEGNDSLYLFTASYEDNLTGVRDSVPLGVDKATGQIVNCTVDED